MTLDEASRLRILTAPGGDFPLVDLDLDGVRLEMFDRDPRTMRDAFLATRVHAEQTAIVYEDQHWTYRDQWDTVVAFAHALQERGLRKGDRLGIAMRNYPEFIFSFWAGQLLGAVVVPFNGWLKRPELAELVRDTRPEVLVVDGERLALLAEEDLLAYGVHTVVGVRCDEAVDTLGRADVMRYGDFVARLGEHTEPPAVEISADDPSTILFTSGTTAKPKGAQHTHRNHSASLLNKLIRAMRVGPAAEDGTYEVLPPAHSVKLVTFPFFHIAGMNTLYTACYSGHTMVLLYKWDAASAVSLVEEERVNELAGPPFVVQTFLEAAASTTHDLSSLRVIGMGGSAAPTKVIAALAERFGDQVTARSGYGLTETTSGVVAISAADFAAHPDSVGRALPTAEVAILDPDGNRLTVGQEGEIAIRGPQVVSGYLGMPAAEEFRDGWFRSGDLGRVDESGLIYIVGRLKDVVIRGGENINCAEVEAVLAAHHDVVEAAALGASHPALGEELVAVARVRPGSSLRADELREFAAERLAAFKVPVRIAFSDLALPRTPSGKVIKREIVPALGLAELIQPRVDA